MTTLTRFFPAILLVLGTIVLASKPDAVTMALRGSLDAVPRVIDGHSSNDITISPEEIKTAGTSAHLMRTYGDSLSPAFSLYVGYHAVQSQDNQMHSPRNCLPGAGWQVLTTARKPVGSHEVNRVLLEYKGTKALVLYWYQGRGRVTADEFQVKLRLFADAAKTGRTEEALVRLVIPVAGAADERGVSISDAEALGVKLAAQLIPTISELLPASPSAAVSGIALK